jgi:tyrosine-specific transport protein
MTHCWGQRIPNLQPSRERPLLPLFSPRLVQSRHWNPKPSLLATQPFGEDRSDEEDNDRFNVPSIPQVLSAALLIAGTTVGGGFLALPSVVAPTGFYPSALALVSVWAFLGGQAWTVVEVLCAVNNLATPGGKSAPPGMAAAARATFGVTGERIVTLLLFLVVEATLVSQISRAGMMLSTSLYRMGCSLAAISVGAVVFGPRLQSRRESIATSLNSVLMLILCAMAVLLFTLGLPAADWSRLSAVQNFEALPQAIPTCLQLLVYGEILPTVCHYLNFKKRPIAWAIGLGSILPLFLEIGWAALGIGLNPGIGGSLQDPVALLLQTGPIQVPLFCLAISAILTTILGSYLALKSTMDDVLGGSGINRSRLFSGSLIVLPALAIASISPSLFLQAIDFAGSYPVLLLWGVGPPIMALRLRNVIMPASPRHQWWILTSFAVSVVLLGMSAVPDVARVIGWLVGIARTALLL